MRNIYTIGKYKNKWAVFDTVTCVWYFPSKSGKVAAQAMVDRLNNMEG